MKIEDWPSSKYLSPLYREIRERGLESNIAELEAFGFTMIENFLTQDEIEHTKSTILRVAERRLGRTLDISNTENLEGRISGTPLLTRLVFEDPWFEELMLRTEPLLIMRYLMGESLKLNSASSHIKAGGADGLYLHADISNGVPSPLPPYSCFGNLTYTLTDYTLEGGALAMVPGSHRWCRHPSAPEAIMARGKESPLAVPLTPKAGAVVIWHGNTWHGAFARTVPGIRMNLVYAFCRQFIETQEAIKGSVPEEMWNRHKDDPIFAGLMGEYSFHGWKQDSDFLKINDPRTRQAGQDWHA